MKGNEEMALKAVSGFTLRRPEVWGNGGCAYCQRCNMMCRIHGKYSIIARGKWFDLDGLPNSSFKGGKQRKKKKFKLEVSSSIQKTRKKKNTDVQLHPVCPAAQVVSSREILMTSYGPEELSSAPSSPKVGYGCDNSMCYWEDTWGYKYTIPTAAAISACQTQSKVVRRIQTCRVQKRNCL